jgi:hypothetical protein
VRTPFRGKGEVAGFEFDKLLILGPIQSHKFCHQHLALNICVFSTRMGPLERLLGRSVSEILLIFVHSAYLECVCQLRRGGAYLHYLHRHH